MRKRTLRNLLSFLLVLVLTICAVAGLSMVTQAKTDASLPVVEEAAQAAQLSASVPASLAASPLLCVGAFLVILAVVAIGLTLYRRRGKAAPQGRRSYVPRADMAFSGRNRV